MMPVVVGSILAAMNRSLKGRRTMSHVRTSRISHYIASFVCLIALFFNAACEDRGTLNKAAFSDDAEMARRLIAGGDSDINLPNDLGATPLHVAAMMGSEEVARILIEAGADLEVQSTVGTPLHVAVNYVKTPVAIILLDAGASLEARTPATMSTPLHTAAGTGDYPLTLLLIYRGADVNALDSGGSTPMDTALLYRYKEVVDLFRTFSGRCVTACMMEEFLE